MRSRSFMCIAHRQRLRILHWITFLFTHLKCWIHRNAVRSIQFLTFVSLEFHLVELFFFIYISIWSYAINYHISSLYRHNILNNFIRNWFIFIIITIIIHQNGKHNKSYFICDPARMVRLSRSNWNRLLFMIQKDCVHSRHNSIRTNDGIRWSGLMKTISY